MRATMFLIQKFCISPTALFSCVFHMIHPTNSECIHQKHIGPSAYGLIHLTTDKDLGWACSRRLCATRSFCRHARPVRWSQPSTWQTDFLANLLPPSPPSLSLCHSHK